MAQNFTNNKVYEVVNLADEFGNTISPFPSADTFSRLRITEPYTIGDYKHTYGINPEFFNVTSGTGATIYFNQYQSSVTLVSGTGTSSYAIHQTQRYHNYLPGKSQLIYSSVVFGTATTNVTKRTGYYDNRSGIYFEQDSTGVLNFVIRNYINGSPSETRVPQSQWNTDKCDGTGPSKMNIDITKTQLVSFAFQWLGVGIVVCGFTYQGNNVIAHKFYHANFLSTTYMTYPNLPVRCEILNTGSVSTGNSMVQICASVISEGGYSDPGYDYSVASSYRGLGAGSTLPVLAIKAANTFYGIPNRVATKITNTELLSTATNVRYKLIRLPSSAYLTGGTWVSAGTNSSVEYNIGATSYTDGEIINTGFSAAAITGQGTGNASYVASPVGQEFAGQSKKNFICSNYDCTDSSVYVLVVENLDVGTGTSIAAAINWREVY